MNRERRWNSERQCWEFPALHHIDGNPLNNDPANLRKVWPSDHALSNPPRLTPKPKR